MPPFLEYPKWLHCDGQTSVIVDNADAEATQLAVWGAEAPPEPAPPIVPDHVEPPIHAPATNLGDWDGNGKAGGSAPSDKPANALTTPQQPKPRGWPKGKPRPNKRQ